MRRLDIERRWWGERPSAAKTLPRSTGIDVHRIKIDADADLVILSQGRRTDWRQNGIAAIQIQTGITLWALPQAYTNQYPHVEYDHGFLVFNVPSGHKDVWRRSNDFPNDLSLRENTARPAFDQEEVAQEAAHTYRNVCPGGYFQPWCRLLMPEDARAFRFVYPTLLVASHTRAYLWDIPSGRLIQTIEGIQELNEGTLLGAIHYVELSERHVYICGRSQLRVFSRAENGKLLLAVSSAPWTSRQPTYQTQTIIDYGPSNNDEHAGVLERMALSPPVVQSPIFLLPAMFNAAHVSPCGRHLAILTSDSKLLLVEDLDRVLTGNVTFDQAVTSIALGSVTFAGGIYLAYGRGRVAAATASGVFVLTLNARRCFDGDPDASSSMDPTRPSFPHVRVSRVIDIDDVGNLRDMGCLQLTDLGVWFAWGLPWKDLNIPAASEVDDADSDSSVSEHETDEADPVKSRLMWVDIGATHIPN
ncbi:hypothetical protein PUNSTDRAFT_145915 [Punctularia strigosozonata HHB-11173 SS5]|uniref:uncharacterized protein n=1 Tax=Punctularia strigosozonata (strain HHB-11173) TaxID=741275 RepID=UPI0004417EFE|nr:uncharacterized protein PUNSTDRAFT_145915 [Punctularia strigosozonata HHB-11173 SS5]EIN05496.1 hypothetical protein PUNSTDRAFT_145915 [Punctularia strigosozonata HHB-11173 SS5]